MRLLEALPRAIRRTKGARSTGSERICGDFLPAAGRRTSRPLPAERRSIKLDMAALAGDRPRAQRSTAISGRLPRPPARRGSVPFDLVIEEYQLRREIGSSTRSRRTTRERFPAARRAAGSGSRATRRPSPPPGRPASAGRADRSRAPRSTISRSSTQLGRGAFARVYLARQISMQRLVALKVSAGKGDEPQALAQFDHPNIVRVYDQRALDGGETHLLYMQYLPGRDARRRGEAGPLVPGRPTRSGRLLLEAIRRQPARRRPAARPRVRRSASWLGGGPVADRRRLARRGQLGRALDDAHHRGVLHRDVKPANVLLSAEGVPKLADFNVSMAGAAGRAGAAATLGGSIGYMAPGAPRGDRRPARRPRPTTWPNGCGPLLTRPCCLWELWQGRRPFEATGARSDSWTDALAQPDRRPR